MENNNNIVKENDKAILRNVEDRVEKIDRTKELVVMALFVAIDFILGEVLVPVKLPTLQVSFAFIAIALTGMYLGPVRGMIVGIISDLIGGLTGMIGGQFFIGFTISAALNGLAAGYFLEGKKSSKEANVITWAVVSSILISWVLTTVWLVIMYNDSDFTKFLPQLIKRAPTNLGILVAKIITIPLLYTSVFKRLKLREVERPGIR